MSATSREDERKKVDQELADMRQKFYGGSHTMSSAQRRKFVWKMCYIYVLGYEVDFHIDILTLLSSTVYQEKAVGYMGVALLLRPGDDLMALAINSINNDLIGFSPNAQYLALNTIANIAGKEFSETFPNTIEKYIRPNRGINSAVHLTNPVELEAHKALQKKKSILALVRLFRSNPDCLTPSEWPEAIATLLEDPNLGVVTSTFSLLLALTSQSPVDFEFLCPFVISLLSRLVVDKNCPPDYIYHRCPSPWIQTYALRFLQFFKSPIEEMHQNILNSVLSRILGNVRMIDTLKFDEMAVVFESISLIFSYGSEASTDLKELAVQILGQFLQLPDNPNVRYHCLEALSRLARLEGPSLVQDFINDTFLSLDDIDISIQKKALNLLFLMTDEKNVRDVLERLVQERLMRTQSRELKEDLVVKISILAEKYAIGFSADESSSAEASYTNSVKGNLRWYLDIMTQTILIGGDVIAESVWFRVAKAVTGHSALHEYAAEKMMQLLLDPMSTLRTTDGVEYKRRVTADNEEEETKIQSMIQLQLRNLHDTVLSLASYLLGEIGVIICEKPGCSGYEQFIAIHKHYISASDRTQALMLTSYVKFLNLYPDTKDMISELLRKYSTSCQLELQQRACEYLRLSHLDNTSLIESVLDTMPNDFTFSLESLEEHMQALESGGVSGKKAKDANSEVIGDRSAWSVGQEEKERSRAAALARKREGGKSYLAPTSSPSPPPSPSVDSHPSHSFSTPAPPRNPPPPPPPVDLLDMDDTSHPALAPVSQGSIDKIARNYRQALLCAPGTKAVLFEDERVKVVSVVEVRGHQSRVILSLSNNHPTSELRNYSFELDSSSVIDGLSVKMMENPAAANSHRPLPFADEFKAAFLCDCMKPFSQSPKVNLSFQFGPSSTSLVQARFQLTLPIRISTFCEPVSTPDKDVYLARWRSLTPATDGSAGNGSETQEVFTSAVPIDANIVRQQIRGSIFSGFHIALATGLDTSDYTATGCCSLRTGTIASDGSAVSVGVMLRIEADVATNKFRVTVRAKHPLVAKEIKELIKSQLTI